jgi:hypothetical protein
LTLLMPLVGRESVKVAVFCHSEAFRSMTEYNDHSSGEAEIRSAGIQKRK